jgi:hypothetical protein
VNEAGTICDQINRALPNLLPGSLRFWGVWFGRPYDGAHRIVACEHDHRVLRLRFHYEEQLTVWSPVGLELTSSESRSEFRINDAERVLWQFFYAGRPKTDANRFFYDFVKTPQTILATSNVNWFTPNLITDPTLSAVQMLSLHISIKST